MWFIDSWPKIEAKFAVKAFKLRGVSKEKRKELESEAVTWTRNMGPAVLWLFLCQCENSVSCETLCNFLQFQGNFPGHGSSTCGRPDGCLWIGRAAIPCHGYLATEKTSGSRGLMLMLMLIDGWWAGNFRCHLKHFAARNACKVESSSIDPGLASWFLRIFLCLVFFLSLFFTSFFCSMFFTVFFSHWSYRSLIWNSRLLRFCHSKEWCKGNASQKRMLLELSIRHSPL